MLMASGDGAGEDIMLRNSSIYLMYGVDLHARAFDEWNATIEWSPRELFQESKKAAFAGVLLPFVELFHPERTR
jgi:hypothetical protein